MSDICNSLYRELVEAMDEEFESIPEQTLYDEIVEDSTRGLVEYRSTSLKDFLCDNDVM